MEIVCIETSVFNAMCERMRTIEEKVDTLHRKRTDLHLKKWLDNQEVCDMLGVSKRTLQVYRDNGVLPFTKIKHKVFYKPEDVQKFIQDAHHPNTPMR